MPNNFTLHNTSIKNKNDFLFKIAIRRETLICGFYMITRGRCMDEHFFLLCVRDKNRTRFRFYCINYAAWYMVAIGEEVYRIYNRVFYGFIGQRNPLTGSQSSVYNRVIILKFLQQVHLRYFGYRINSLCVVNPVSRESIKLSRQRHLWFKWLMNFHHFLSMRKSWVIKRTSLTRKRIL